MSWDMVLFIHLFIFNPWPGKGPVSGASGETQEGYMERKISP